MKKVGEKTGTKRDFLERNEKTILIINKLSKYNLLFCGKEKHLNFKKNISFKRKIVSEIEGREEGKNYIRRWIIEDFIISNKDRKIK